MLFQNKFRYLLNQKSKTMTIQEQYRKLSANTAEYFECQLPILSESEKAICFDASNSHLSSNHRGGYNGGTQ